MADLTLNPTPAEIEIAESEGWCFDAQHKIWSKYDNNCVTVLDLQKFRGVSMSQSTEYAAALEKAAKEGDRFLERLAGRTNDRTDGAFVAITRLVRNIRALATESSASLATEQMSAAEMKGACVEKVKEIAANLQQECNYLTPAVVGQIADALEALPEITDKGE